jgi:mannose-1-phosphate guanylyltransferase
MNANELADELDDYYIAITDEYTGFGYLKEAATMLRQQQAEIEYWKEKFNKAMEIQEK